MGIIDGEGKIIDFRKTNIDSCNSPVGESFCLVFHSDSGRLGGPSLRQRWFPGTARSDGRRVPTTLPNRSHRSSLVGCCVTAEIRDSRSGAGQVYEAAAPKELVSVCQT